MREDFAILPVIFPIRLPFPFHCIFGSFHQAPFEWQQLVHPRSPADSHNVRFTSELMMKMMEEVIEISQGTKGETNRRKSAYQCE